MANRVRTADACLVSLISVVMAMAGVSVSQAPPAAAEGALSDLSAAALSFSDPAPVAGDEVELALEVAGTPLQETTEPFRGAVVEPTSPLSGLGAMCPCVLGSAETGYTMWYSGISDGNFRRILRATSADGITWSAPVVSMERASPNECVFPWVVDNGDGTMTLWFTNINYRYTIMRATSSDGGLTWSAPVLEMTYGQWFDLDGVNNPRVFYDGTQYRMWYVGVVWATATEPAKNRICHAHKARLSDAWVKDGIVLDCDATFTFAKDPFVSVTGDGYDMLYCAGRTMRIDGIYRMTYGEIRHAVSADGLSWTVDPAPFIVPVLPDDGMGVHMPFRSPDGGVYYTGTQPYGVAVAHHIMYLGTAEAASSVDATCSVSFYVDGVCVGTVDGLAVPGGGRSTASVRWTATPGTHAVTAEIHSASPAESDLTDNAASATIDVSQPLPAALQISKVLVSGPVAGSTFTYYQWTMLITVANTGGVPAIDLVVRDVIPAELEVIWFESSVGTVAVFGPETSILPVTGFTVKGAPFVLNPAADSVWVGVRDVRGPTPGAAPAPPEVEPVRSTHLSWRIDSLAPGENETLVFTVCTRLNPAGKQEFTSPGTHLLNEGACVAGYDAADGSPLHAGPTAPITVQIF